ncbi:MAG: GIY-YIG nuclease family protein [Ruminococcaceae bacterium]|nr:GIY-YIG nuclease family protein [Oscillospiraceae bacterium]
MNYTYILRCADGTFYTGWTNNLEKRLKAHNAGTGGKYTRARRPVTLVWYQEHADKIEAQRSEYAIKQLSRAEKLALMDREGIKA